MRDINNATVVGQQFLAGGTHHHYYGSGEPQRASSSASTSDITQEKLSAEKLSDLHTQLNEFYEQQAQLKYLFYDLLPIPISQAPRLALVLEREQKKKEQKSVSRSNEFDDDSTDINNKTEVFQDQRINSFEDIYGTKKPVELSKLHEKQDEEDIASNLIFVRGRAGVGKSTLLQYIANEYVQGRLWNDRYDWVFWIPLRNLSKKYYNSGKEITLAEVIYQECFQNSKTVTLEDIERLLASNPKILWLVDGYDEIAALDQEDTPIGRLLKILLASEHVILTSRPYATPDNLHGYKQLENIGFLNEDIEDYVKKFFVAIRYPERNAEFLTFLKQNSLIWGTAHIPIMLELLCTTWNERKNQGKTLQAQLSMTELYKELMLKLCIRYLKKRSYQPIEQHDLNSMADDDVLEKCETLLEFLSELAFEASRQSDSAVLIDNTLIQNLRKKYKQRGVDSLTLFNDVLESHFLKNTGNQSRVANQDFYFVHLTFQEFFTAYRIVQKLKQNDPSIVQFIKDYKYVPAFETTWWFVAGLLKDDSRTLETFFDDLEKEPRDLIGLYHNMLLMRCMDECFLQIKEKRKQAFLMTVSSIVNSDNSFLNKEYVNAVMACLSLSPRVFDHPIIMGQLTANLNGERHLLLKQMAKLDFMTALPQEILKRLVGLLLTHSQDYEIRGGVRQILQNQIVLPPTIIEDIKRLLEEGDLYVREGVAKVLIGQAELPECIITSLCCLITSAHVFPDGNIYAALTVGRQRVLPDSILEMLITGLERWAEYEIAESTTTPRISYNAVLLKKPEGGLNEIKTSEETALTTQSVIQVSSSVSEGRRPPALRARSSTSSASGGRLPAARSVRPPPALLAPGTFFENYSQYSYYQYQCRKKELNKIALREYVALPDAIIERLIKLSLTKYLPIIEAVEFVLENKIKLSCPILKMLVELLNNENQYIRAFAVKILKQQIFLPKSIRQMLVVLSQSVNASKEVSLLLEPKEYELRIIATKDINKESLMHILRRMDNGGNITSALLEIFIIKCLAKKVTVCLNGGVVLVCYQNKIFPLNKISDLRKFIIDFQEMCINKVGYNIFSQKQIVAAEIAVSTENSIMVGNKNM